MGAPGNEKFDNLLRASEEELWVAFERAAEIRHRGSIGSAREGALKRFLRDQLPNRFAVQSGEVLDANGTTSGQVDILLYDQVVTRPLAEFGEDNVLLPAEALLAAIEVKSTLTLEEVRRSIVGVKRLHALKPWDSPWGMQRAGGRGADDGVPRIFTGIFGYRSDLSVIGWDKAEMTHMRTVLASEGCPAPHVDRVAVLGRGLLLPAAGSVAQSADSRRVLGTWFFHLVNFLSREVERRPAFDWSRYEYPTGMTWTKAAEPDYEAPSVRRATGTERLKARRSRNRTEHK